MIKLRRFNFYFEFFERSGLPYIYEQDNIGAQSLESKDNSINSTHLIYIVNCVPPYFKSKLKPKSDLGYFSKTYRKGFVAELTNFKSSNEFLMKQMGRKRFKNLRQDINRLRREHPVFFKMYYGDVKKTELEFLMQEFKTFIEQRFDRLGKSHAGLSRWRSYEESIHEMIIQKKASLNVLFLREKPIGISLNYHYNNEILDAAITSFDINYRKYSIGKQMLTQRLRWCFENNYKLIDLRWGDFGYKRYFSSKMVRYETQVFYKKKSTYQRVLAFVISNALFLKYFWKEERSFGLFVKT